MLLYSDTNDFLDNCFIPPPNPSVLDDILKKLQKKRVLIPRSEHSARATSALARGQTSNCRQDGSQVEDQPFPLALKGFAHRASEGRLTRSLSSVDKLWAKLETLAKDIRQCMEKAGLRENGLRLSLVPDAGSVGESGMDDSASDNSVEGGQRSGERANSPASVGLSVPVALRLDEVNTSQNKERLVRAMRESMDGDISRNFIYGISIEDDRVSLWYSTRKTTIKATSFSYVNRPDLLIRVFVSLFSADREALGYEPHITRLTDGSYLYELDGISPKAPILKSSHRLRSKSAQKQPQSFFFKTTHLISKGHTYIWNAVEVTSKNNLKPKHKDQEIVLKDTWVDADSATEFELQRSLFQDIDSLKQSDWESLPILKCIPRDREGFARLRSYLKDDSYKSLFLRYDERMCYTGRPGKSLPSEHVWEPVSNQVEPDTLAEDVEHNERNRRSSQRKPREEWPTQNPPTLSSKKRCFFVFPELCTRVSDLPTLGDAMEVLNQAYFALLIMFCAGWVHRDISDGNVLAIKVNRKWSVRLSDLEFAKKCSPTLATSSNVTIGTPHFMAYEIKASLLLWVSMTKSDPNDITYWDDDDSDTIPFKPVVHTFFHDLESLWWLILWLITSRIGCDASKIAARDLFQSSSTHSESRRKVLIQGINRNVVLSLHDDVKPIAARLDPLRIQLYLDYNRNSPEMRLEPKNYAPACAIPLIFFQNIGKSRDVWASLPLQRPGLGFRERPQPSAGGAETPVVSPSTEPSGLGSTKRKSPHNLPSEYNYGDSNEDQPGPPKRRRLHHRGAELRRAA
ncbi:hypothetical protein D9611_014904 [Ephemerocybe angulata]|uniref:Fungal-type protein kinase domain-containing protein n=1 Tax=Ephemerocybe angulata TaxID=980116 RepID=A0A8H5C3U1_9AGAR|nr:hypothetical protein D9611_014904 [Tulosesus angulatus]